MTTLSYENEVLSNPADGTEVDTNFDSVKTVINGNLDTANLKTTTAGITNAQLATSIYEFVMNLQVPGGSWGGAGATAALCGLPYDSIATGYTVLGAEFMCFDAGGSGSPTFDLDFGYVTAGAWVTTTQLKSAQAVTAGSHSDGAIALGTSTFTTSATQQNFIRLVVNAAGTAFCATAGSDILCVSLKIKRTNGLRS